MTEIVTFNAALYRELASKAQIPGLDVEASAQEIENAVAFFNEAFALEVLGAESTEESAA